MPCKTCVSIHRIRAVLGLLVVLALAGCFASDTPMISRTSAQDVGQTFEYWSRSGNNPKEIKLRFVRKTGNSYQLQVVDPADLSAGGTPFANGVTIRRFGTRGAASLYMVQLDLTQLVNPTSVGVRYMTYLVSVDRRGLGSVGSFACDRAGVVQHARNVGLKLSCRDLDVRFPYLGGRPTEKAVSTFLSGLLRDGLVNWEDKTGVGVLDWIN